MSRKNWRRVTPSRDKQAAFLRELRAVPATHMTIRERNRQMRSLLRTFTNGFVVED